MGKEYDYLDDERKKLWHKVNSIETEFSKRVEQLSKRAPDFTDEAKQSSRKATEYKNKIEESKNTASLFLEEASIKIEEIRTIYASIEVLKSNITQYANDSSANSTLIEQNYNDIQERKTEIETQIEELEAIFEDHDSLIEKVSKIQDTLTQSDDTYSKIETLYKSLLSRKKEIDQLYFDIFGYSEKDPVTGVETSVEGLKDELENSYEELNENLKKTDETIKGLQNKSAKDFELFADRYKTEYKKTINDWTTHYTDLATKIRELLPNALTAGLSSAYSEKKDAEMAECSKLNKTFNLSILGLVGISLIPFIISIVSLTQKKALQDVLLDMPRLVLSILPLYIPVLWVAYSSNRKMNLSKRLSEEYSHKEVLSKTYEGLSTQINNITDKKVSSDLRNKLLYNILEVAAENPGKLISDYNKSDHPLMDALDKSVKLATAFEKLEKIPGFSKLAKAMDKKSKSILEDENEKANRGIAAVKEDD